MYARVKTTDGIYLKKLRAEQRAEQFVQIHARITCARKISTRKNRQIVLHHVERGISEKRIDDLRDVLQVA